MIHEWCSVSFCKGRCSLQQTPAPPHYPPVSTTYWKQWQRDAVNTQGCLKEHGHHQIILFFFNLTFVAAPCHYCFPNRKHSGVAHLEEVSICTYTCPGLGAFLETWWPCLKLIRQGKPQEPSLIFLFCKSIYLLSIYIYIYSIAREEIELYYFPFCSESSRKIWLHLTLLATSPYSLASSMAFTHTMDLFSGPTVLLSLALNGQEWPQLCMGMNMNCHAAQ